MVSTKRKHLDIKACHWLPCSIKYDGLAPVHMFFRPETVEEETNPSVDEDKPDTGEDGQKYSHLAASFRGRGLLANEIHKLPENVLGCTLSPELHDQKKLRTGDSFHEIIEWEHEWDKKMLLPKSGANESIVQSESSVQKSIALIELLRAVHDPIPVET